MNKTTKTIIALAVVGGAGWLLYQYFFAEPKIELERINWDTGEADVTVNGKLYSIVKNAGVQLNNGYSIEFGEGYRDDLKAIGVMRLELKQNGVTKKILDQYS
jgi:hypothetical protein